MTAISGSITAPFSNRNLATSLCSPRDASYKCLYTHNERQKIEMNRLFLWSKTYYLSNASICMVR
jgi:hypothetical protein